MHHMQWLQIIIIKYSFEFRRLVESTVQWHTMQSVISQPYQCDCHFTHAHSICFIHSYNSQCAQQVGRKSDVKAVAIRIFIELRCKRYRFMHTLFNIANYYRNHANFVEQFGFHSDQILFIRKNGSNIKKSGINS